MNHESLRQAREELDWSRGDLVSRVKSDSGLTVAKLAAVETGRRPPSDVELAELRRVLFDELEQVLEESGEHPVVQADEVVETTIEVAPADIPTVETEVDMPGGIKATRSTEWNGMKAGDQVRVRGERGVFTFIFHHRDPRQEYVEVYGPRNKPKERSFQPNRVKRRR